MGQAKVDGVGQFLDEAAALEAIRIREAELAQQEFDTAWNEVEAMVDEELKASCKFREARDKVKENQNKIEEGRANLYEAQKKLAMLEVFRVNQETLRRLEEQRNAAINAAQAAKKTLMEQRLLEKRALAEAAKQIEQGSKRSIREVMTVEGPLEKRSQPRVSHENGIEPIMVNEQAVEPTVETESVEAMV